MDICIPKIKATQMINKLGVRDHLDIVNNLEEICAHHNAYISYSDLSDCEGRLIVKNGYGMITVRDNFDYPGRTRHSIAHEFGHFNLHLQKKEDDIESWLEHKNDTNIELEANQFAAEFLMPSHFVSGIISRDPVNLKMAKEVSSLFETSLTGSLFKTIEVSKHLQILICFDEKRVRYFKRSKKAIEHNLWPDTSQIPKYSIINNINSSNYNKSIKRTTYPNTWFQSCNPNLKVNEETIYFSNLKFGVNILTIE